MLKILKLCKNFHNFAKKGQFTLKSVRNLGKIFYHITGLIAQDCATRACSVKESSRGERGQSLCRFTKTPLRLHISVQTMK